ncbi:hypothetical protein QBC33DRAFT_530520 [Phialemonium atrogriseum]|uniref:Uncharacterized protein n=1 Tax=Phialemonium atrogriseum TaxID=1093897 RepID=A0AAJ0C9L6_9PEZI|nr:uncharacterized protein QBC33DRAFT_530520 [Phialemonium atrogriseum]KAK1770241.1 hypothetical protein QBC33DRAFT_530520 [Phialemonium atrogriseum]
MASSTIFSKATASPAPSTPGTSSKTKVARRLRELDEALGDHKNFVNLELESIKEGLEELERRRQLDSARAAVRHEILFGALKKIHEEMSKMKGEIKGDQEPGPGVGASPRAGGKKPHESRNSAEGRKNLERCLGQYTQHMETARTVGQVKETGKLCTDYSESIFKTYT